MLSRTLIYTHYANSDASNATRRDIGGLADVQGGIPQALTVTAGSDYCAIDADYCATDGPGDHGNGELCTIRVAARGFVTASEFDTESGYDWVTIGDAQYQGSTGPISVAVAANSTFTWRSDGSVTNAGWTICFTQYRYCMGYVDADAGMTYHCGSRARSQANNGLGTMQRLSSMPPRSIFLNATTHM